MFESNYSLLLLLTLVAIFGIYKSARIMKLSHFKSLVAWHSFSFLLITAGSVLLTVFIDLPVGIKLPKDDEVTRNFILAALLSYIIQIIYLIYLQKKYRSTALSYGRQEEVLNSGALRPRHFLFLGCVFVGFLFFLNDSSTQYALENIKNILTIMNYKEYYAYRTEQLFLETSNIAIHVETITMNLILPLFNLYAMFCWKQKKTKRWRYYWLLSLLIWIMYSLLTLQKGVLLTIALSNVSLLILMTKSQDRQHKKITWMRSAKLVGLFMFSLYAVYNILGFEGSVALEFLGRVLIVPGYTIYTQFLIFPEYHPFLYYNGSTTMNWLLGFGQATSLQTEFSSSAFISSKMSTGSTFSMNTNIIGDGWANYGFVGVIECSIILFGILMFWDIHLKKNKPNLPIYPLIAFFIGRMFAIINGDLQFMLTRGGFVLAPLIYLYMAGNTPSGQNQEEHLPRLDKLGRELEKN